jgi:hypothetical protein
MDYRVVFSVPRAIKICPSQALRVLKGTEKKPAKLVLVITFRLLSHNLSVWQQEAFLRSFKPAIRICLPGEYDGRFRLRTL